jgi:membrane-bound lytic murein transglycosylase B
MTLASHTCRMSCQPPHFAPIAKLHTTAARRMRGTISVFALLATFIIASSAYSEIAAGTKNSNSHAAHVIAHKRPPRTRAPRASQSAAAAVFYASRPEAMRFADDLAERRNLDREWVRQAIGQARMLPTVARLMQPAAAGVVKNWHLYRSRFVEPIRIRAGVRFWQENAAALARAEATYGVPAEVIVGIIGVETIYGQQTGNFRVMDALATLAFDFPENHPRAAERSAYFRSELEQVLTLADRNGIDPFDLRGSYAGAMGLPQFMPSSWNRYAVDFDGDGHIDLQGSAEDAIGSVANYLRAYGWKPGMPATYPVELDTSDVQRATLLAPDILPTFDATTFNAQGAHVGAEALQHVGPLALIELQNGSGPASYVAGTENFYVITRYNWSSYYAMAVLDLGRAVAEQVPRLAAPHPLADLTDKGLTVRRPGN